MKKKRDAYLLCSNALSFLECSGSGSSYCRIHGILGFCKDAFKNKGTRVHAGTKRAA